MQSLLVAASFAPSIVASDAAVKGMPQSVASDRGTTTHLPAEPLNSHCTDSKQALATGRGLDRPA
jgi:hypothetical protein